MPVILLTAKDRSADKVVGLTAGADDYIVKPFDTLEMVARVRSTCGRNARDAIGLATDGLPGNYRIEQEIARRLATSEDFAVCHVDMDNFKAFNDAYGFLRGDDVIMLLAGVLQKIAGTTRGPYPSSATSVATTSWCCPTPSRQSRPASASSRRRLLGDGAARRRRRGQGLPRGTRPAGHRPALPAGLGVHRDRRGRPPPLRGPTREIVAVAAEMKTVAKATAGSAIAVDRRADAP